jgi:small-conductance mechanosensitive channel
VSLGSFGLLAPTLGLARRILGAELVYGALRISAGDFLAFGFIVWAAFIVAALVRFVLEEDVFSRLSLSAGVPYALSSLTGYVIVTAGFTAALFALGLNLDRVTVLGGAFGVGIGFGLQNVVNNFVSGLIVLFERPIHVGDEVQIGNVQGEVQRIGIRACTIRIGEGAEVIVPNSQLVAERVTNWTPAQRLRRVDVPVNVSYGTTPEAVLQLLTGVAEGHADVAAHPPPRALFLGFGDSALRFELRAWTQRLDDAGGVKSELGVAVCAALREAGMTIPFPQQEIHIRSE